MTNFLEVDGEFINLDYVAKVTCERTTDSGPYPDRRYTFIDPQGKVMAVGGTLAYCERAFRHTLIPALPGFLGLHLEPDDYTIYSAPVIAFRVIDGLNTFVEQVTAIGADGLDYLVIQWPDGRVSSGPETYADQREYIEHFRKLHEEGRLEDERLEAIEC
jgi:hypothetical protein